MSTETKSNQQRETALTLLHQFVYHWRRGNLHPYQEHFAPTVEKLCAQADALFPQPVSPFAPLPEPESATAHD